MCSSTATAVLKYYNQIRTWYVQPGVTLECVDLMLLWNGGTRYCLKLFNQILL